MTEEAGTESRPAVVRSLMSPRQIRLNSAAVAVAAAFIFWINLSLDRMFHGQYTWIGYIAFATAGIMSIWGFVIANRRAWWIAQHKESSGEDQNRKWKAEA